jgi:hypothetical protein
MERLLLRESSEAADGAAHRGVRISSEPGST